MRPELKAETMLHATPVTTHRSDRPDTSAMDPMHHAREITFVLSAWDFPWDVRKALELALFRTYAVPHISGLLSRTGEFARHPRKRYDDTEIILAEILQHGPASRRGSAALQRMNEMHARYRIPNDAYLYVLSTFVCEPVRWIARFGWRDLTRTEITAFTNYYRQLGELMGMTGIPLTYEQFDTFNREYEDLHFAYAPSNAEIGSRTVDLLLGFYLPKPLIFLGRPAVHALLDDPLRQAMGFKAPPKWLRRLVPATLRLRAKFIAALPRRKRPMLLTAVARPTYPNGYRIENVGSFGPVACPHAQAGSSRTTAE